MNIEIRTSHHSVITILSTWVAFLTIMLSLFPRNSNVQVLPKPTIKSKPTGWSRETANKLVSALKALS